MTITASQFRNLFFAVIALAIFLLTTSVMHFVSIVKHEQNSIDIIDSSMQAAVTAPMIHLPDIASVARAGWFGLLPEEQALAGNASSIDLLSRFDLRGISQSENPKLMGAFIAEKGKQEIYYHIGDSLPENAGILNEIFSDHITIKNGQILSTLKFPQATGRYID